MLYFLDDQNPPHYAGMWFDASLTELTFASDVLLGAFYDSQQMILDYYEGDTKDVIEVAYKLELAEAPTTESERLALARAGAENIFAVRAIHARFQKAHQTKGKAQ